jgi:hypothetical protein
VNARSRLGTILTVTALGAAIGGCGGSSSSTLTRAQLDTKANAICAASNAKIATVHQPPSLQDANVAAAYFDKIEPIVADASAKLGALKPDSGAAADWNSYISLRTQGLTLLQTLKHKADTKDPSGLQDLAKVPALQQKIVAAAATAGAKTCTQ